MASERKPGSDRGRSSIDWQQAFQYYASMPSNQRDYRQVASHFGSSVRTVERHGQKERWRERARKIDAEAAARAAAKLAKERAAKLADIANLIDAALVSLAQQLRDGRVRMSATDLVRLHKLQRELWDEPADEIAPSPAPAPAAAEDEADHKLEVLRALRDAGVLQRLEQLADAKDLERKQ